MAPSGSLVDVATPLELEGRPPSPHRPQTGPWVRPAVDGIELFNIASVLRGRERFRG